MYRLFFLVCVPLQGVNFFPAPTQAALNEAILTANTNGLDDVIDLSGQTITLTTLEPGLTTNALRPILSDTAHTLLIRNGVLVRSATAPDMRIIQVGTTVSTGANLSIENLVLKNGFLSGVADTGGAILVSNASALTSVTNSLFEENLAGASGGAIAYGIAGFGGATAGSSIVSSKFTRNRAVDGGAIYVFFSSGLSISNSIFNNNRALASGVTQSFGGAITVLAGTVASIDTTSFTQNSASTTGTGSSFGGAISLRSSAATNGVITLIDNSTFEGNTAGLSTNGGNSGGAIQIVGAPGTSSGVLTKLRQSTFFGNQATGLTGIGGAIAIGSAGQITNLFNATIARNSATTGGGIHFAVAASGVDNTIALLRSTIVALNTATTGIDIFQTAADNITAEDFNLVGNNSGSFLVAGTPNANLSYVGTAVTPIDPVLSLGENNGGNTKTLALLSPTSVAIDNGINSDALSFDQRGAGYLRERVPGEPDIGAYELQNCGVGNDDDNDGICDDVDGCDLFPNP